MTAASGLALSRTGAATESLAFSVFGYAAIDIVLGERPAEVVCVKGLFGPLRREASHVSVAFLKALAIVILAFIGISVLTWGLMSQESIGMTVLGLLAYVVAWVAGLMIAQH